MKRTLRIVVYSQLRTLISMVIVLALAVAFLWGGSRVINSVTGAAPPPPTATVQPAIEQPTVAPTAAPTKTSGRSGSAHGHGRPTATPRATAIPHATPTPNTPPKVFMTASLGGSNPQATFHLGQDPLYCWVRNNTLPPGAGTITFNWVQDKSNTFLYQYPEGQQGGPYTGAYFHIPQVAGAYRCDIVVNGQTFGSARFSLTP